MTVEYKKNKVIFLSSGFQYSKHKSYNLGDIAQQQHGIQLLKEKLPGWEIVAVANSNNESKLNNGISPDDTIIKYISAPFVKCGVIRKIFSLFRCALLLISIKQMKEGRQSCLRNPGGKEAVRQIISSDMLFIAGAGNIHDGYMSGVGFFWCLMVLAASIYKIPAVLIGQQIGPLEKNFPRWFASFSLKRASFVGVRDHFSYNTALAIGISKEKIFLTGDEGWHLNPDNFDKVYALNYLNDLGINGNFIAAQFRVDENNPWEEKIEQLQLRFKELANYYSLPIVFVPFFCSNGLDDRAAYMILNLEDSVRSVLVDPNGNPQLAKGIVGLAKLAVGVANHFCVFAASMGVPTIALYATPYMRHKLKGLEQYCDHVATLDVSKISTQNALLDKSFELLKKTKDLRSNEYIDKKPLYYFEWIRLADENSDCK